MRKARVLIVFVIIFVFLTGCSKSSGNVVVGTKDFTEQYVLGNILALLIEDNTNITVTLKIDLGTDILFAGMTRDTVDIYVEYTGTIYANHLKFYDRLPDNAMTPDEVLDLSKRTLMDEYNIRMLDKLGFNNTFSLAIRADTAAQYNLGTISDFAEVSSGFILGGGNEFLTRSDGIPNLKILYDMYFKSEVVVDGNARYYAITNDEVQVIEAFSTDGMLLEYSLVVLQDDKNFFPPYQAVTLIRDEIGQKHPELIDVINKLTGLLTDDVMRNLNYKVDVHGLEPKDVAEEFLKDNNLIR